MNPSVGPLVENARTSSGVAVGESLHNAPQSKDNKSESTVGLRSHESHVFYDLCLKCISWFKQVISRIWTPGQVQDGGGSIFLSDGGVDTFFEMFPKDVFVILIV